jgi:hypothetical protein
VDSKKITELPYAQERKSSDRSGRNKCRATSFACDDIVSQRLELDGLLALGVLEQTQPSADDFADVVVAAAFDLLADEGLEMGAQGNAGRHKALLTINNYYYLPTGTPCQNWPDASRKDASAAR